MCAAVLMHMHIPRGALQGAHTFDSLHLGLHLGLAPAQKGPAPAQKGPEGPHLGAILELRRDLACYPWASVGALGYSCQSWGLFAVICVLG